MMVLDRHEMASVNVLAFWHFCNKIKKKESTLGAMH
jgi:hypothetical protein